MRIAQRLIILFHYDYDSKIVGAFRVVKDVILAHGWVRFISKINIVLSLKFNKTNYRLTRERGEE